MADSEDQPDISIQKNYDDTIKMVNPPTINSDCMNLAKEWIDKNSEAYRWTNTRIYPEYPAAVGTILGNKISKWLEDCEKNPDAYIKHYTNQELWDERMREACSIENPNIPQSACKEWSESRKR